MKKGCLFVWLAGSILLGAPAYAADNAVSFEEAINASKILANFRLRYETADFDNATDTANALTYRARVGIETGVFANTKFLIDFEHVGALVDDYNDAVEIRGNYPVIADPEMTELNRIQLTNTSLPDTTVTLGRQRIILDDARFVGNVGWRQNEQTYDAIRITNKSIKGLTLDASYIDVVRRIFGPDAPRDIPAGQAGKLESDSWLLNAKYKLPVESFDLSVAGYAYLLDLDNNTAGLPGALVTDHDTYGAQIWASKGPVSGVARYATQSSTADNPVDYTADHFFAEGTVKPAKGLSLAAGYELLGADNDNAGRFQTPLATLHKFNGFADTFLVTPVNGLEDVYIKAAYKTGPVGRLPFINFVGFYHDYSADEGSADLGDEINVVIATKLSKKLGLVGKFADYNQGDVGSPTSRTRFSIQLDYNF